MNLPLSAFPESALDIIDALDNNGHSAYFVGGCVRDNLMGKVPHDYDITTDALPHEIIALGEGDNGFTIRYTERGRAHGTIVVQSEGYEYEVTTLRRDGRYGDDGRYCNVQYSSSILEDLSRRDLTINAIAYSPIDGVLYDPFGGIDDIKSLVINTVGNPGERFEEDPLRVLRAIRFSSLLGFQVLPHVLVAMEENSNLLDRVSSERIGDEVKKIFQGSIADDVWGVLEGALNVIGISPLGFVNPVGKIYLSEFLSMLSPSDFYKKLFGGKFAKERFGISRATAFLTVQKNITELTLKECLFKYGENNTLSALRALKFFDILDENLSNYLLGVTRQILRTGLPVLLSQLRVDGSDLLELGFKGRDIGDVLSGLLRIVWEHPEVNNRLYLLGKAQGYLSNPDSLTI